MYINNNLVATGRHPLQRCGYDEARRGRNGEICWTSQWSN